VPRGLSPSISTPYLSPTRSALNALKLSAFPGNGMCRKRREVFKQFHLWCFGKPAFRNQPNKIGRDQSHVAANRRGCSYGRPSRRNAVRLNQKPSLKFQEFEQFQPYYLWRLEEPNAGAGLPHVLLRYAKVRDPTSKKRWKNDPDVMKFLNSL
jgi:hypothetical protein